jgi:hypothetical protein
MDLFDALHPILQSVNQLKELLEDTQTLAGSEAYAAARLAYRSAKVNGKNMGMDEIIKDLSRQFQKTRKAVAS